MVEVLGLGREFGPDALRTAIAATVSLGVLEQSPPTQSMLAYWPCRALSITSRRAITRLLQWKRSCRG